MPEKNPIENMVNQLAGLLEVIALNRHVPIGDLPDNIEEQLKKVTKDVDLFCQVNQEMLEKNNYDEEKLKKVLGEANKFPVYQKELLQKIGNLRVEAEAQKQAVAFSIEYLKKQQGIHAKKPEEKNFGQKRKKKFKGVGGDKGWIPL